MINGPNYTYMYKLVFRCINGISPSYLCKLLTPPVATLYRLRSQTDSNTLVVPFTKCKTFADRAFSVAGLKTWNDLSDLQKGTEDALLLDVLSLLPACTPSMLFTVTC